MKDLRLRAACIPILWLALLSGCALTRSPVKAAAGDGTQLNCSSCKRACELAGDARGQGEAVASCKADCERRCR
jgi:hypothetical protein